MVSRLQRQKLIVSGTKKGAGTPAPLEFENVRGYIDFST
jgi:hypothetical protein